MVQILPPKFNVGTQIGQALGGGIQSGMQQGLQRGMLQQALGKIKGLTNRVDAEGNPIKTDPLELTLGLMEAGAGIPGSERYLSTLLPMLLNQARVENIFGDKQAPSPEDRTALALGGAPTTGQPTTAAEPQPGTLSLGLTPPGEQKLGGFLSRITSPDEMKSWAQNYAIQLNDPNKYLEGLKIKEAENAQAKAARDELGQLALATNKVSQQELPEWMQIAERFGHLKDPNEIVTSANRDFSRYRNAKDKLDNAIFPGFTRGALQKGAAGFSPTGLLAKFLAGGTKREQALKDIQPSVKDLVDLGFEDEVRKKLAAEHLSPTEISEIIYPLNDKQLSNLKNFPSSKGLPDKIRQEKLANFFRENVTPDTSLLALRDKLWNEKGYDWREIGPAIRQAMTDKLKLTPQQFEEMGTVEGNPPIQSLTDVFRDYGRWIDFLRGQK